MRRRRLPVTLCAVLTLVCSAVETKVTEQDLTLLSGDHDVPHCFSRNLETVICYWEAEELLMADGAGREDVSHGFYYAYEKEKEVECDLTVQTGSRTLYVCEHDDVILFNDLDVLVKDKKTNRTLCSRRFELALIVIFPHPQAITVMWEEHSERFQVAWKPPKTDMDFILKYEVQFWSLEDPHRVGDLLPAPAATPLPTPINVWNVVPVNSEQSVISKETKVLLPRLKFGLIYHVRVRTSWNGEQPSLWGPWSAAVTFTSLESAETIGLQCFTSDLLQVCCKWDERMVDPSLLQVHYRYGSSIWRLCEDSTHPKHCQCVFPARNDSYMSVKLNVTLVDGKQGLYYHKPFWINHVVLPPSPLLHVQKLSGNQLALNWSSPIPGLGKHLLYQIRFSMDNEKSWTTLQVPTGVHSKAISLVSYTTYTLQIRARPSQEEIQGFWSEWSARVTTKSPSSIVWVAPVVILSLLLILAAGLCLPCILPSFYRKLKNKLWPPLPNLHRVLDTFLAEIQKQYQPDSTLYEKPPEEAAQPSCLEILCELTVTNEGQQVSQDYVQLSPPSYQNVEFWPNLEHLELNLDLRANNQLTYDLTNQTYLPTVWSLQ